MFKQLIGLVFILIAFSNQIQIEDPNLPFLNYHTVPIYGNASLGYFYSKIFIGEPQPQPQSVIIDTGSGVLALPCSQCTNCGKKHIDPPYDPDKSQNSKFLMCDSQVPYCKKKCQRLPSTSNCSFQIAYAEGSILEGRMVEDQIRFEKQSQGESIRTHFGCTTKETNLFLNQKANGIFGLAPKRQSDLLDKMVAQHSQYTGQNLQFSLCLSFNGGLMTIGGVNQELHPETDQPHAIVPYTENRNLYSLLNVPEIRLGSNPLHWGTNYGSYGIFIDSGSTFTYFPIQVYKKVQDILNDKCNKSSKCKPLKHKYSKCFKLSVQNQVLFETITDVFPSFFFQMNGVDVAWDAKKYFLLRNGEKGEICLGIAALDRYILGANWMTNRDIVFNLEKKQISIYDNVQCKEGSPQMGKYGEETGNEQPFNQPIKIILQIISLVCFILAMIACGFLWLRKKKKQKKGIRNNLLWKQNEQNFLTENRGGVNNISMEETG